MPKKTTKKPPKKESAPKVFRYGVFDKGGSHYIRAYKGKKIAEKFAEKPEVAKTGYDVVKYPGQMREVKPLSKEEYQNLEAAKQKAIQEYIKQRKKTFKNYNVVKPEDYKGV